VFSFLCSIANGSTTTPKRAFLPSLEMIRRAEVRRIRT
jgi:hypothetical protein